LIQAVAVKTLAACPCQTRAMRDSSAVRSCAALIG